MTYAKEYTKDPDAVLDYSADWSSWLANGETITTHAVAVGEGLTLESSSVSAGVVTAWLSGGTTGASYVVGFRITTSEGRTDERSVKIYVKER